MRGKRHIRKGISVRIPWQAYFEHADGFSTVRHRREHVHRAEAAFDGDHLAGEGAAVRGACQRHALRGLPT